MPTAVRVAYELAVLTAIEARVIGCLMEKEVTTPDVYPLTLNALTTAANQTTNREPLMRLASHEIEPVLVELKTRGLLRVVHSPSNRATKYRQVIHEALNLNDAERALICMLLLRGAQTTAELRTRTERLHRFDSPEGLEAVLTTLSQRPEPLARRLERQPGQSQPRWIELLSNDPYISAPGAAPAAGSSSNDRIAGLESRVAELEERVAHLLSALGED